MRKLAHAVIVVFIVVAPMVPWLWLFQSPQVFCQVQDSVQYYTCARMIYSSRPADIFLREKFFQAEHEFFPAMNERVVPMWLPPFSVLLLSPIALLPASTLWFSWTFALWFFLLASVFVLAKAFKLNINQSFWLWTLLVISAPAYESFHLGQLAPVMLFSLSLAYWCLKRDKPLWAGCLLSVLSLKPQVLLPFVALLAGARKWKPLAALAFTAAFLAALAYAFFGADGFANWFSGMKTLAENPYFTAHFTLRGQLARLPFLSTQFVFAASAMVYAFALGFAFFCGQKFRANNDWLEKGLVACMPLGMVAAPYLSTSDLLLLAPTLVAYYLSAKMKKLSGWPRYVMLFAASLYFLPLYVFVYYDFELKGSIISPLFGALAALSAWLAYASAKED